MKGSLPLAGLAPAVLAGCLAPDLEGVAFSCESDADCAGGFSCAYVASAGEKRCLDGGAPEVSGPCAPLVRTLCEQPPGCEEVCVAAASFAMGCQENLDGACAGVAAEHPPRRVLLSPFLADAREVTRDEFAAFLNSDPPPEPPAAAGSFFDAAADPPALLPGSVAGTWKSPPGEGDLPMVHVHWPGASAYCHAKGQALCSEARWEAAARGGCEVHGEPCEDTTPPFPWGTEAPTCDRAVFAGCGGPEPSPADARPSGHSPYGARDLAGNVEEWVADCFHESFDGAPDDGTAWLGSCAQRVVKGGSFESAAEDLRASARAAADPLSTSASVGFRCCTGPSP